MSLLIQIGRHLRAYKALRAQLIIDHYIALTPRNGRYSSTMLCERRRFEQVVLAVKPGGPVAASSAGGRDEGACGFE